MIAVETSILLTGLAKLIINEQVRCLSKNIGSLDSFVPSAEVEAVLLEKPLLCEKLKALFT
jgi:hypothetical protein